VYPVNCTGPRSLAKPVICTVHLSAPAQVAIIHCWLSTVKCWQSHSLASTLTQSCIDQWSSALAQADHWPSIVNCQTICAQIVNCLTVDSWLSELQYYSICTQTVNCPMVNRRLSDNPSIKYFLFWNNYLVLCTCVEGYMWGSTGQVENPRRCIAC